MSQHRIRTLKQNAPPASDVPEYFTKLGLGGFTLPGQLNWNCYPDGMPENPVSSATANVDGDTVTLVPEDAIAKPYYLTHLASICTTSGLALRWTLSAGSTAVRILRQVSRDNIEDCPVVTAISPPYKMPLRNTVDIKLATPDSATRDAWVYLITMQGPVYRIPNLMSRFPSSSQSVILKQDVYEVELINPNVQTGSWSDYVEVLPAQPTPVVIQGVNLFRKQMYSFRVAFATQDANGVNTDWGIFGLPAVSSKVQFAQNFNLYPWPLYVPSGLKITARIQNVDSANPETPRAIVNLAYMALP